MTTKFLLPYEMREIAIALRDGKTQIYPVAFQTTYRGRPVPKQRPRHTKGGHTYTPEATRKYEQSVSEHLLRAAAEEGFTPALCPVKVELTFWVPAPAKLTATERLALDAGMLSPTSGDLDNLVKAVTDAANGILYMDDKQINAIYAERYVTSDDDRLGFQLELRRCGYTRRELSHIAKFF